MKGSIKIAIACDDELGLDGQVSAHFGRCPAYTLVDVKAGAVSGFSVVRNPHFNDHQPGVMPKFIKEIGADVIVAGGMGPKAIRMFEVFGIEVATGAIGHVGRVLDAYLRGEITGVVPCAHDHADSCGGHEDHQ